ncbi:hypothetical protein [Leifsonia xyli]|nr:hypothetical protein [Leifsonia xyli]
MALSDSAAMDRLANLLGTNPEWSSPADYLEDIANLVAATGGQHPGDADPDTYNPHRPVFDRVKAGSRGWRGPATGRPQGGPGLPATLPGDPACGAVDGAPAMELAALALLFFCP